MTQLTLDMPEEAFATLHQTPKEFVREMRIAAAVKWYELGRFGKRWWMNGMMLRPLD